jgi:hypothetical protein
MSSRALVPLLPALLLLAIACEDPMMSVAPPALATVMEFETVTYAPVILEGGMGGATLISDAGIIVGFAGDGATGYPAVRWMVTGAGITGPEKLGMLPYPFADAHDQHPSAMNSSGVVVGTASGGRTVTGNGAWIYTEETKMRLLPGVVGRTYGSDAQGINEQGIVVGMITFAALSSDGTLGDRTLRGAAWLNAEDPPILLPPLPGHAGSGAGSINSAGLVTGWSSSAETGTIFVTWRINPAGEVTDGPHALEAPFRPGGLNEAGDIAGSRQVYGGSETPALLRAGRILPLALLRAKDAGGSAYGIGEPGTTGVVRITGASGPSPVLWTIDTDDRIGGPIDLGLPSGFQHGGARSVNAMGWIVGSAARRNAGTQPALWLPQQGSGGGDDGSGKCKPRNKCN